MRLIYFAWVRERIGKPQEDLDLPAGIETVNDLLAWLRSRGEEYEQALKHPDVIRVAIDQEHVDHDEKIAGAHEIALFPPMTGG
ncbi:molybdopterin converting factor subunit 1 [Mesorhizobium sp. CN5-321]|jgi:molybdopterin synthase sulfur carrier subunit|uniref:molybdopterin converting factor subunit 1 n=1 Tax=Mesorhizobium hunchu TaxID=3157708 RepID=UPI0032B86569